MIIKKGLKMNISKELLSEVLNTAITEHKLLDNEIWYSSYEPVIGKWKTINIHELAHKCKEWALTQDIFNIVSGHSFYTSSTGDVYNEPHFTRKMFYSGIQLNRGSIHIDFKANTEPEAIFKACQWILDNKDNK